MFISYILIQNNINCFVFNEIRMTLRRTNSWGYKQNDDTFDGMIGSMMRREVDIAGSPMYFRTERHEGLEIIFHETLIFSDQKCCCF